MEAVGEHLRAHVPFGRAARARARTGEHADDAAVLRGGRPRAWQAAYGKPVARMGSGGSIPLVARLQAAYPDAAFVLWGAQDSDLARIHAVGESVDLGELEQIALAEALLLTELAGG